MPGISVYRHRQLHFALFRLLPAGIRRGREGLQEAHRHIEFGFLAGDSRETFGLHHERLSTTLCLAIGFRIEPAEREASALVFLRRRPVGVEDVAVVEQIVNAVLYEGYI